MRRQIYIADPATFAAQLDNSTLRVCDREAESLGGRGHVTPSHLPYLTAHRAQLLFSADSARNIDCVGLARLRPRRLTSPHDTGRPVDRLVSARLISGGVDSIWVLAPPGTIGLCPAMKVYVICLIVGQGKGGMLARVWGTVH